MSCSLCLEPGTNRRCCPLNREGTKQSQQGSQSTQGSQALQGVETPCVASAHQNGREARDIEDAILKWGLTKTPRRIGNIRLLDGYNMFLFRDVLGPVYDALRKIDDRTRSLARYYTHKFDYMNISLQGGSDHLTPFERAVRSAVFRIFDLLPRIGQPIVLYRGGSMRDSTLLSTTIETTIALEYANKDIIYKAGAERAGRFNTIIVPTGTPLIPIWSDNSFYPAEMEVLLYPARKLTEVYQAPLLPDLTYHRYTYHPATSDGLPPMEPYEVPSDEIYLISLLEGTHVRRGLDSEAIAYIERTAERHGLSVNMETVTDLLNGTITHRTTEPLYRLLSITH